MTQEILTELDLATLGVTDAKLMSAMSRVANGLITNNVMSKEDVVRNLNELIADPVRFVSQKGGKFRNVAALVVDLERKGQYTGMSSTAFQLNEVGMEFPVFGRENIEAGAFEQMSTAMKLPITMAGALMSDAHQGYGLPIGGVLATTPDTIIPYAVGVDIACRMCLSVFDVSAMEFEVHRDEMQSVLMKNTHFGIGSEADAIVDGTLFDKPEWGATKLIRRLKDKAYKQLGTSGSGNHFVEWGMLTVEEAAFDSVPAGTYIALLSHSGSRGFGGTIAAHYSHIAMHKTRLPDEAKKLAWLDLATEEGQEYWLSMNLAGDYASANHHEIHNKITMAMNLDRILMIENHHNFAWKERLPDKTEVMVHRKGATPAGRDVLGIIPGSMATPGFVVKGKGDPTSINSASHGAGRAMSRKAARQKLDRRGWKEMLSMNEITLLGSDIDEAPLAYKDIHTVMQAQTQLVEVLGTFQPKIVRMADSKEKPED